MKAYKEAIRDLMQIPGVGTSIADDLWNINVRSVANLKGKDPEALYHASNRFAGAAQDRCLLYVFRCAVYYTETDVPDQDAAKLKWWNWKDKIRLAP